MPYFILFSHYANSTRSTEGLGYFTPYCSWSEALIAQRAEASILRPSEQCLQPHNKSRECFSSGSQKPRLPARRDGVKDLLTPPSSFPWPEHRHFHLPPFPPQFTSVQRLAAYRPLFLPPHSNRWKHRVSSAAPTCQSAGLGSRACSHWCAQKWFMQNAPLI